MHKKNGFTVIELIVVIALLGVVMALGYNIWLNMKLSYKNQEKVTEAQGKARNAIHLMINEIKRADEVNGINVLDDKTINVKKNGVDTSYKFVVSEHKIFEEVISTPPTPRKTLVDSVDSFTVTKTGDKIEISIKITDAKEAITGEYVQRAGIVN